MYEKLNIIILAPSELWENENEIDNLCVKRQLKIPRALLHCKEFEHKCVKCNTWFDMYPGETASSEPCVFHRKKIPLE